MMKKISVFPKSEPVDYNGHYFDPQVDFSLFLEEARKNRSSIMQNQASPFHQKEAQTKMSDEDKKSKRWWKRCLFSWWKVDKKSKPPRQSANSVRASNLRPGSLSGPIYGSERKAGPTSQARRHTSGPITSLFTPARGEGISLPYVSLDQLNHPIVSQAYGPVYLVT
ncbi:hypothetical protein IFM89_039659 [Coptis chinensis]|uniref:Uncharacterized protein n=1 Tax=Coptis chinensis TaxID=261450 RepID=A0A835GT24_9MAGN|nr:hypothetical protein IFM89_039659 [Coptis chinensis]